MDRKLGMWGLNDGSELSKKVVICKEERVLDPSFFSSLTKKSKRGEGKERSIKEWKNKGVHKCK